MKWEVQNERYADGLELEVLVSTGGSQKYKDVEVTASNNEHT